MAGSVAVPRDVLKVLHTLHDSRALTGFYLAGGTSLALRFGHRISMDLDFFHPQGFSPEGLLDQLNNNPGLPVEVEYQDEGTLRLAAGDRRIKVEFFRYRYPLLRPVEEYERVPLASETDVGLMKVNAICARGSQKDFIDLYWIAERTLRLSDLLRLMPSKFGGRLPDPYHVARSFAYFADAEREPPARLLAGPDWAEIRRWFAAHADTLLRDIQAGHLPW